MGETEDNPGGRHDSPLRLQSQSYVALWAIGGAAIAATCVAVVAAVVLTRAESSRNAEASSSAQKSSSPGANDDKTVYIELNLDSADPATEPSALPTQR